MRVLNLFAAMGVALVASSALAAPPPNPSSLSAQVLSAAKIKLNWNSGGGNTAGFFVNYNVGSSYPSNSCTNGTKINVGNVTTHTIVGLNPSTQHSFRVCAYNALNQVSSGATLRATTLAFVQWSTRTTWGGTLLESAEDIAVDANGKFVLAGFGNPAGQGEDFGIARYTTAGAADTTFSGDGKNNTSFGGSYERATALVIDSAGRMIMGGRAWDGVKYNISIARYLTNGNLDTSFGVNGLVLTQVSNSTDEILDMVIDAQGRLVVGGACYFGSSNPWAEFCIARYDANGNIDASFGNIRYRASGLTDPNFNRPGVVVHEIVALDYSRLRAIRVDSSGRIVAAGRVDYTGYNDIAMTRYLDNGTIDTSFGTNGVVLTHASDFDNVLFSIQFDASNRIVGAGHCQQSGSAFEICVLRYMDDGSLDTSFGTNGMVFVNIGPGDDKARFVAMDGDKMVVAGRSFNGTNDDMAILRLNADGSLDTSFGYSNTGYQTFNLLNNDQVNAFVILPDGKIVVGGSSNEDFVIAKLNP